MKRETKVDGLLRLGVLGSGRGSNLDAIASACARGDLAARIELVISDIAEAGIGGVARRWGIPFEVLGPSTFRSRLEPHLEEHVARRFVETGVQWVVLAGYMRVVKAPLLSAFTDRILNIHPSLLPAFPGKEAWKQALDAGVSKTGCTVHLVDSGVDTGRILGCREVPVLAGDTAEILHARIQEAEHLLYPEVLRSLVEAEKRSV